MKPSTVLGAGIGMLLLILDSRCAANSARESLELCLRTVIPSLFPMFVLSGFLASGMRNTSGKTMSFLEDRLGLPCGGGLLFLLGIVGGFPVGAQCIAQAVESGNLSRSNGERLLGFCNNCSPAFLFGIVGSIFPNQSSAVMLFLIQLEAALLVAYFTEFEPGVPVRTSGGSCSLPEAVNRAIRSMASVCAWVILAGVVTGFLDRWVYPFLPVPGSRIISGLLEITGGIIGLTVLKEQLRFLLSALFLCFGGICVWMQIGALASGCGLSTARCFRQKTVQGLLGTILAAGVLVMGPFTLLIPAIPMILGKKGLEKPIRRVYNGSHKGGYANVVP